MLRYQCVDGVTETESESLNVEHDDAVVPVVRVCLLQTVRVPPHQRVLARAQVQSSLPSSLSLMTGWRRSGVTTPKTHFLS